MDWLKTEREKLKRLSAKKKLEYIWQYYKLWMVGAITLITVLCYVVGHMVSANKENQIYVAFVNTYADLGESSAFWDGYAAYSQIDTQKKSIVFDTENFFDMTKGNVTGNYYYEKVVVLMDSKTMDAIVMEKDNLTALGASGRLLDLNHEKTKAWLAAYADRIVTTVYTDEDGAKHEVPVGIDISDSTLVTEEHAYGDSCVLGISAEAQHIDAVGEFLDYVLKERNAA